MPAAPFFFEPALMHGYASQQRWGEIRAAYALEMPKILAASERGGLSYPYFIDWNPLFTPIEFEAWADIRRIGLPLYPQVPVGRRFVDFGDPFLKIAVELDGAAYHDRESDTARDEELWRIGWRTFRIRGAESFARTRVRPFGSEWVNEYEDNDEAAQESIADWQQCSSDGFFDALAQVYYNRSRTRWIGQPHAALDSHRYIDFPISLDGSRGVEW